MIFSSIFFLFLFLEGELALADSFFNLGHFEGAIGLYQKYLFYNLSPKNFPYPQYKLALSYLKRGKDGDWLKGEGILREIASLPSDSGGVRDSAQLSLIRHYVENKRYEAANSAISDFLLLSQKREMEKRLEKWKGILFLKGCKLKEAKKAFMSSGDSLVFYRIKGIKWPKKEWVALFSSLILPGSGEIYSGKITQGLLSLSVNTLLFYGAYRSLRLGKRMDALLIFSFLFLRFYRGSVQNATQYARDANENYLKKILKEIGEP